MTKEKQFLPEFAYHFVMLPYSHLIIMFYIICCACQVLLKKLSTSSSPYIPLVRSKQTHRWEHLSRTLVFQNGLPSRTPMPTTVLSSCFLSSFLSWIINTPGSRSLSLFAGSVNRVTHYSTGKLTGVTLIHHFSSREALQFLEVTKPHNSIVSSKVKNYWLNNAMI